MERYKPLYPFIEDSAIDIHVASKLAKIYDIGELGSYYIGYYLYGEGLARTTSSFVSDFFTSSNRFNTQKFFKNNNKLIWNQILNEYRKNKFLEKYRKKIIEYLNFIQSNYKNIKTINYNLEKYSKNLKDMNFEKENTIYLVMVLVNCVNYQDANVINKYTDPVIEKMWELYANNIREGVENFFKKIQYKYKEYEKIFKKLKDKEYKQKDIYIKTKRPKEIHIIHGKKYAFYKIKDYSFHTPVNNVKDELLSNLEVKGLSNFKGRDTSLFTIKDIFEIIKKFMDNDKLLAELIYYAYQENQGSYT